MLAVSAARRSRRFPAPPRPQGAALVRGQDLERGLVFPVRGEDKNRELCMDKKEEPPVLSLAELDVPPLGAIIV